MDLRLLEESKKLMLEKVNGLLADKSAQFDTESRKLLEELKAEISTISSYYSNERFALIATNEIMAEKEYLGEYTDKFKKYSIKFSENLENILQSEVNVKPVIFMLIPFRFYSIKYLKDNVEYRMFSLADFLTDRKGESNFTLFYYFMFSFLESDKKNALIKTFIHEECHLLLHLQSKNIWRFIDEGIAQCLQTIGEMENPTNLDPSLVLKNRKFFLRQMCALTTSFENLFVSTQLLSSISGIEQLKYYINKFVVSENVFCDISILNHSENLTNYSDNSLVKMFVNYILAKMFVTVLVLDYDIKINELIYIAGVNDLTEFLSLKGIDYDEVGSRIYSYCARNLKITKKELSSKLYDYYQLGLCKTEYEKY